MIRSKHFEARTNQRGITAGMLELVYQHGHVNHKDRTTLSKKTALKLLKTIDHDHHKSLKKIIDKGGIELVEEEGVLITAYRLEKRSVRSAS